MVLELSDGVRVGHREVKRGGCPQAGQNLALAPPSWAPHVPQVPLMTMGSSALECQLPTSHFWRRARCSAPERSGTAKLNRSESGPRRERIPRWIGTGSRKDNRSG